MALNAEVWGPHYWFVLYTMALTYPPKPNDVLKKKYYDFIQNVPLFLPVQSMGNSFAQLLDKYPVTPYLDSQTAFLKWMHFIHNKVNLSINKPEITLEEAMVQYYEHYKPKAVTDNEARSRREKIIFCVILFVALALCYGLAYR
jgi:hypothetical protein